MDIELSDNEGSVVDASSLADLQRAWMNEKHAPELLPYQHNLMDVYKQLIEQQEEHLAIEETHTLSDLAKLALSLYVFEVDRIRFLLNDYHAIRISKIEKHWLLLSKQSSLTQNNQQWLNMNYIEQTFLLGYYELMMSHFKNNFLQYIDDETMQDLDLNDETLTVSYVKDIDLNQFVFVKPREDIGEWLVSGDGNTQDLQSGMLYLLNYFYIRSLVLEGRVDLI
ncbi:hypothetical protein GEMRC1_012037 [Eukaryota sp. GEM-RC1]